MTTLPESEEPIVKPVYWQASPNQTIDLGTFKVQFSPKGEIYECTANVTMQLMPYDRLLISVPFTADASRFPVHLLQVDHWGGKIKLVDTGVDLDVLMTASSFDSDGKGSATFTTKASVVPITQPSTSISSAVFHLFNFPDFCGPEDYQFVLKTPTQHRRIRCGRITMKAGGWTLTIAATGNTQDTTKALGMQGGYAITHMAKIEREDGGTFSDEQLRDLLESVHLFLSFTMGCWVGVAFAVGFDANGNRVFEQWGLPLTAHGPWNASYSWFDRLHGEFLPQVFPGFLSLLENQTWHDALKKGVYWYLAACDRSGGMGVNTETGLLLAQTALEHLAWTYCIEDRKMLSKVAFSRKGLSAADRLRLFTSSLGIPIGIPSTMTALNAKRGIKWEDIPHALTSIRNSLVHPSEGISFPNGSDFEAWELSMWLLDVILLRLCGHRGYFSNRITKKYAGNIEKVPWVQ